MFYLELLRQRTLGGNVFCSWEGRKKKKKMSGGTLNLRKGGLCLFQQELHEHWIRSSGRADTWDILALWGGILFLREDKSVTNWYLRKITLRDCGQPNGSAVKPDSTVPSPLQITAFVHSGFSA